MTIVESRRTFSFKHLFNLATCGFRLVCNSNKSLSALNMASRLFFSAFMIALAVTITIAGAALPKAGIRLNKVSLLKFESTS